MMSGNTQNPPRKKLLRSKLARAAAFELDDELLVRAAREQQRGETAGRLHVSLEQRAAFILV